MVGINPEFTIHQYQKSLFKKVNPNINVIIDEPFLYAENILPEDVKFLEFVTNVPSYINNNYEHLVDINIYIDNIPYTLYGLLDIIDNTMKRSDTEAFINKNRIYKPFIDGFGKNKNYDIVELIDILSDLAPDLHVTKGKKITFEFVMDETPKGFLTVLPPTPSTPSTPSTPPTNSPKRPTKKKSVNKK